MQVFKQIILTAIISSLTMFIAYKYIPLSWYETQQSPKFGSTITTIQGIDTISGSRTTINNNFSNLNTGKFELSDWYATTSIPQVITLGTITGGVWNGTAIGVGFGGTGTTTPTSNQVIIGNGASGFKVIGFGSAGQFLSSNGNGSTPSWVSAAFDSTQNYNFTGTDLFKNFNASSTSANPIILNGVSYNTPSSQGANGTFWMNDGSGNLTSQKPLQYSLISGTPITASSGFATSTLLSIPANVMTASSTISIHGEIDCAGGTTNYLKIVNQNGSPFVTTNNQGFANNCGTTEIFAPFDVEIYPNYSVSSQTTQINGADSQVSGGVIVATQFDTTGTSAFNLASAFSVGISIFSNGSSNNLRHYSIIVNP